MARGVARWSDGAMPPAPVRRVLTPSMLLALLALLVAVGGTGYAAGLAKNSVGTKQLKDDAVTTAKLAPSTSGQPVLRSGRSMTGGIAIGSTANSVGGSGVTFPNALPASFDRSHVSVLFSEDPVTSSCPGPGKAKKGWACVYFQSQLNAQLDAIRDFKQQSDRIDRLGFTIFLNFGNDNTFGFGYGTYTVRAP